MDILLDQNATFICEVESRPPAVVTWTKNNQPITLVCTINHQFSYVHDVLEGQFDLSLWPHPLTIFRDGWSHPRPDYVTSLQLYDHFLSKLGQIRHFRMNHRMAYGFQICMCKYSVTTKLKFHSFHFFWVQPTSAPLSRYHERYMTREHGQMLLIPHARESDNGEYCCLAINGVGEPAKSCGALQLKMSESSYKVHY